MLKCSLGWHHVIQGAELYQWPHTFSVKRTGLQVTRMKKANQLFTISQLSSLLNVSKPTLRFWEKEFSGILVPLRTTGGQRRYNAEHVEIVTKIRSLKNAGMKLDEIRMNMNRTMAGQYADPSSVDILAERVAEIVKKEIVRYLESQAFWTSRLLLNSGAVAYR